MTYLSLFWSFLQIGLFSVGGGYAAMPLIKSPVVERYAWLSMKEYTDLITIAEMTPGPIAVNAATFVGTRLAGFPGAVVATAGCILPSVVLVSLLAFVYSRFKGVSALQSVLAALRPAIVALIASAGLSILGQVCFGGLDIRPQNLNPSGLALFALAFFSLRKYRWNPILVMALCGAVGLMIGLL